MMRVPLYDHAARRRSVSVTLNADLVAKSTAIGINISRVAEAALIVAFEAAERENILREIREATRWTDDYVRQHGHPFPEHQAMFMPDSEDDDAA